MASEAEAAIRPRRRRSRERRRLMSHARAGDRGRALGGAGARRRRRLPRQLAYLFERSRFYRDKLERARALRRTARSAASPTSPSCRSPKRTSCALRAAPTSRSARTATAAPGRHRAHLFDQRHDRDAELHSADRRRSRRLGAHLGAQLRRLRACSAASGSSRPTTPGPFVAGAALDAFDRLGLCHIPVGSGNTERLIGGGRAAAARASSR